MDEEEIEVRTERRVRLLLQGSFGELGLGQRAVAHAFPFVVNGRASRVLRGQRLDVFLGDERNDGPLDVAPLLELPPLGSFPGEARIGEV